MSEYEGWIQLHRKSLDNPIFKKPLIWHYWNYCLLKANHKDKRIIWNCKEITVKRGSFISGLKEEEKNTGLTSQNLRTCRKTLSNLKMLEISTDQSTGQYSVITICNYDTYQTKKDDTNSVTNSPPTGLQQPANSPPTTNNNDNNYNNVNNDNNNPPIPPLDPNEAIKPRTGAMAQFHEIYHKIKPTNYNDPKFKNAFYQAVQSHSEDQIIAGAMGYAKFINETGELINYVKSVDKFLSEMHYLVDWDKQIQNHFNKQNKSPINILHSKDATGYEQYVKQS